MYRSKIDSWLLCVVAASSLTATVVCVVVTASAPGTWFIAVPILLISVALPMWIFCATRYRFIDTELVVCSGPFRWRIPPSEVVAVTPTRNPLSSPALSLDRLRIDYGRGRSIMVSPQDKDGFVRRLASSGWLLRKLCCGRF
jgi:Bacterial PH domain